MVWQLIIGATMVLLPFALLLDLHPERERLDARGRPLSRHWEVPDRHGAASAAAEHDH